jgi:hypothetical protein
MFWHPDLCWFDRTEPLSLCSWCFAPLRPGQIPDLVWLRVGDQELRLHPDCFAYVDQTEGLLYEDVTAFFARKRYLHL